MRKDVHTNDIAPNIRHVHSCGFHSVTLTLAKDESNDFMAWAKDLGLFITQRFTFHGTLDTIILTQLNREQVMLIKLAWARTDASNPPKVI
jgi:hypothetical protein